MPHFTPNKISAAVLTAALLAFGGAVQAAAPMAKTSAPGYFRMMLGSFEVTALSDGTVDLPVDKLLAQAPEKTQQTLAAAHLAVPLETSVNTYLINTGSKLVMIDTGAAGLFGPTLGKLLANLKAAGYDASQIDEIYITHLHPDHVGGLLADGKAAFPNAIVRADKRDSDFWLSEVNKGKAPDANKGFFDGAMNATAPYVAAKKFVPFSGDTQLIPGVRATSSYGHTPGHTTYEVESGGKKLVLIGDLIHVAAVQLPKPGLTIAFDSDAKAAAQARMTTFAQAAKNGTIVGASHIQFPGLGYLRADGKQYQWMPVNYTQMR
jgi:glyoxylase-like metal-dependent hydrolase (beta-lactamase superfamily II)